MGFGICIVKAGVFATDLRLRRPCCPSGRRQWRRGRVARVALVEWRRVDWIRALERWLRDLERPASPSACSVVHRLKRDSIVAEAFADCSVIVTWAACLTRPAGGHGITSLRHLGILLDLKQVTTWPRKHGAACLVFSNTSDL